MEGKLFSVQKCQWTEEADMEASESSVIIMSVFKQMHFLIKGFNCVLDQAMVQS